MKNVKSIHLQIEHKVLNFREWRKAFERDPVNRKKAGVRCYKIFRPINDPDYVIIDLEFDNLTDAESTLIALRSLWTKVEGKIVTNPQTRILNLAEAAEIV